MPRRTWVLVIGPPRLAQPIFDSAEGLYRYHAASPAGSTLDIYAADKDIPLDELRRLSTCWFRDEYAQQIRQGAH